MPSSPEPRSSQAATDPSIPERTRLILDFERRWWRHAGAKEEAIAREFALTSARYYQLLNAAIDTPEALRYDPILVGRLLRARESRLAARASRRFPTD